MDVWRLQGASFQEAAVRARARVHACRRPRDCEQYVPTDRRRDARWVSRRVPTRAACRPAPPCAPCALCASLCVVRAVVRTVVRTVVRRQKRRVRTLTATPHRCARVVVALLLVAGVTVLSEEPWVIVIDDFLSSAEADEILKAGSSSGTAWGRSQAGDGVQAARTSSTAWCKGKCLANPTVRAVEDRVSTLLGIPMENAEPMQVLRYETGQFYKVHHDQNSPRASAWGPRMFTVFLYIGDESSYEGGETHFPRLNLTIPKGKGKACIWTSVLDSDPYQRDDRTDHESLPVASGVKYGVNCAPWHSPGAALTRTRSLRAHARDSAAAGAASIEAPRHRREPSRLPSHAQIGSTCTRSGRNRTTAAATKPILTTGTEARCAPTRSVQFGRCATPRSQLPTGCHPGGSHSADGGRSACAMLRRALVRASRAFRPVASRFSLVGAHAKRTAPPPKAKRVPWGGGGQFVGIARTYEDVC